MTTKAQKKRTPRTIDRIRNSLGESVRSRPQNKPTRPIIQQSLHDVERLLVGMHRDQEQIDTLKVDTRRILKTIDPE